MQHGRVKYLDGIRIMSSVVVCISHAIEVFLMPKLGLHHWLIFSFKYAASTSVVIFFVLSGYMVTNSIFNNQRKNGAFKIEQYWKDRMVRLYPPLLFAIGLTFVLYKVILIFNMNGASGFRLPNEINLSRDAVYFSYHELLYSLFFIQGFKDVTMWLNGPLWSLGEEFVLYIIASMVSVSIMNKKIVAPTLILCILFLTIHSTGHLINCYYLYGIWGFGALLSIEQNRFRNLVSPSGELLLGLVALVTFCGVVWYKRCDLPEVNYQISAFAVMQATFIIALIFLFRVSPTFLQNKIQIWLEKITPNKDFTYTLYVVHFPILIFLFSAFHNFTNTLQLRFVTILVIFIIVAIIYISKLLAAYLENKSLVMEILNFCSSKLIKK